MSSSGLKTGNKIIREESLNDTECILLKGKKINLCPITAIRVKFLQGWWKPREASAHTTYPKHYYFGVNFMSVDLFERPEVDILLKNFKQNLRVFYRSIPVSFLFTNLHCRKMNLMVVKCWKGWTHLFPSPGLRCHFFCLALLFSPPSGEPLQGVPFLHKAYPSLLPTQRKTLCCFRSLSWIPKNSERMLLLVGGRRLSDHLCSDLELYLNFWKLVK